MFFVDVKPWERWVEKGVNVAVYGYCEGRLEWRNDDGKEVKWISNTLTSISGG